MTETVKLDVPDQYIMGKSCLIRPGHTMTEQGKVYRVTEVHRTDPYDSSSFGRFSRFWVDAERVTPEDEKMILEKEAAQRAERKAEKERRRQLNTPSDPWI